MNVEYGIPCARQYARALTPLRRHHQTRANHAPAANRCRSIRRSDSNPCNQNPRGNGDDLDVLGRTDTPACSAHALKSLSQQRRCELRAGLTIAAHGEISPASYSSRARERCSLPLVVRGKPGGSA